MKRTLNDLQGNYLNREEVNNSWEEARNFRSFKELNIATATAYTIQIVVPTPTILRDLEIVLESGFVKLETIAGGTPAGTFSEILPRINLNLLTGAPTYLPQTTVVAGGSVTGGTVIDVVRLKTDGNNTRAASIQSADYAHRGVTNGTYYWRFTNLGTDAVVGTFKAIWGEPRV